MKKIAGRMLSAALALTFALGSVGCRIGDEEVTISRGMSGSEVFLIGGKSCGLPVMKLLLTNNLNLYGESYGISLVDNDNRKIQKKYQRYVKRLTLNETAKVYTMDALATEQGIDLNEEQTELAQWAGEDCYESLSDAEIEALDISQEDLIGLYEHYALAEKLYASLTADVNEEVSEDEARVMQVRQILISDETQAKQAYEELEEGAEFSSVAANYNEADEISLTLQRGMLPEEAETVAYAMENDTYCEPVQTEDGYYIFYCDNKYDEELTDSHKQDIVQQRKDEAFDSVYDPFVEIISSNLNEEVWKSISMSDLEEMSFSKVYEIYEKYFAEEQWIEENADRA